MQEFVATVAAARALAETLGPRMHLLRDEEGWSALDVAVAAGSMSAFDSLLAMGSDPFMPDEARTTILAVACGNDQPAMALRAIELGVDADSADREGMTPLMLAARSGAARCVAILLARGADFERVDSHGQDARAHANALGSWRAECIELLAEAWARKEARELAEATPSSRPASRKGAL